MRRWWTGAAVLAASASACAPEAPGAEEVAVAAAEVETCRIVQEGVELDPVLMEASGAAFDPRTPGRVWTHNDSGNRPELFALDPEGRIVQRVRVVGAENEDWEDLAVGPCPGGAWCLYIADTGDAGRAPESPAVLYRVPLPVPGATTTSRAERFEARFPGGHRDTEALFVLPGGEVYLVDKGMEDAVVLWRWPTPLAAGTVELERVRTVAPRPAQPGDLVTGASASPDGRWVALRSYGRLSLYRAAELLAGGAPAHRVDLAPLGEPQGEGVALADDGSVVLVSEGGPAELAPRLSRLVCTLE